jgi:hypothetical protein
MIGSIFSRVFGLEDPVISLLHAKLLVSLPRDLVVLLHVKTDGTDIARISSE